MTTKIDGPGGGPQGARTPARGRTPPGPKGAPLFGSYFDIQRDPIGLLTRCSREYGHVFRVRAFGPMYVYFFTHPDHLDHLLNRRFAHYPKGKFGRQLIFATGVGLVATDDDVWARRRRILQPGFHRQRLPGFGDAMSDAIAGMLAAWDRRGGRPRRVDLHAELLRLALVIAGRTLFSVDFSADADAVGENFQEALGFLNYRVLHPFAAPLGVPTPRNLRYRRAVAALDARLSDIIRARRASGERRDDLLSMMLDARPEAGDALTDQEAREELRTILVSGQETTAAALFWSFYLLAKSPALERRLHAEVDALGRAPSFDDLPRLPFVRMVIEEALRLYPSTFWLGRTPTEDDEIGGYFVPRGVRVVFSMYITHRHPDFWERPDEFDPDRFSPERSAGRPRGAYLPFGLGPRTCVGAQFALMETQLTLASVAQRYRLLLDGDPVAHDILATLRPPKGVMMRLDPRG
jgi:cytochrome P450